MRIAAAQVHPAWGSTSATTERVIHWIGEAAASGVELVAFGETFLAGYPIWVADTGGARFDDPAQKRAFSFYLDAAVELDGSELRQIAAAARDHRVFTYLGITERGAGPARGTVFCTLVAIDPDRGIVSAHRKLMPTYEERLVWGIGDGHGLRIHEGPGGLRVGGLNCWENWMPQARHAMYAGGEDLHVAVWPGSADLTRDITRFIAREGRVWALSAGVLIHTDDIAADFPLREAILADGGPRLLYDGGSCVAGPDGAWVVEPVTETEGLVIAEIDASRVREERHNFDPTGHYSRPDVFDVRIDRRRREAATFED